MHGADYRLADLSGSLPLQPLFGRAEASAQLAARLTQADCRLLTISGPGGCGKTSLALQHLREVAGGVQRQAVVALAAISDGAELPAAIGRALGLDEATDVDDIARALSGTRTLLLMDNCEHLLPAMPWVGRLIAIAPQLQVLATSRTLLGLYAEQELPLAPLKVPKRPTPEALAEHPALLQALGRSPALALLVARAQAARPQFGLNAANAGDLVDICQLLDGLPLALELAASRLRALEPADLVRVLRQNLTALAGGAVDRPERQRSLRAAVDWSYRLLNEAEQRLFRWLAVFPGSWTLGAAEVVVGAAGEPIAALPEGLESLVVKGLVRTEGRPAIGRFGMLQVLRAFARETLEASGEAEAASLAHLRWARGEAELALPHLEGSQVAAFSQRLEDEQTSLRAALAWSLEGPGRAWGRDGAALAVALQPFWRHKGRPSEGQRWSAAAAAWLADHPDIEPSLRLAALRSQAQFARDRMDLVTARRALEEALPLTQGLDQAQETARTLRALGNLSRYSGDIAGAEAQYRAALPHAAVAGDDAELLALHFNLGSLCLAEGQLEAASPHLDMARRLARAAGNRRVETYVLATMGQLSAWQGRAVEAVTLLEAALSLADEQGQQDHATFLVFLVLPAVHQSAGRSQEAARVLLRALEQAGDNRYQDAILVLSVAHLLGWPVTIPIYDSHLPLRARARRPNPRLARLASDLPLALSLVTAAEAATTSTATSMGADDQAVADANREALRRALKSDAVAKAEAAGGVLPLEAALAMALQACRRLADEPPPQVPATASQRAEAAAPPGGLSAREWAVALRISEGLAYRQVAEQEHLSLKTVEKHVSAALSKLGLANRTQLAVWVREQEGDAG